MKGHGEKVTRKQEVVIAALLAEPTLNAAAAKCGVSESTLWRWMQTPHFQTAYRAARRAVVDGAIGALQQAAIDAVACLRRNLTCGQPAAEVRAAVAILTQVLGTLDRSELEDRLRRLESLPDAHSAVAGMRRVNGGEEQDERH